MIQSAAFAGIGSVGAIYAQLALTCADISCFAIVRNRQSYLERPVSVNGQLLPIAMAMPEEAKAPADLILVAVKWHALSETLEQIAPFVGPGTIILSLLNGVSSERVIAARFPQAHVLLAMCSGIDSNRQGRAVRMNRRGRIVFGEESGAHTPQVQAVADYFARAGIPYETSRDMRRELWWKLMVNVGMNQVSAVTDLDYEGVRTNPEVMARMHRAQREVIAVAQAQGIALDETDIEKWDRQLDGLSSHGLSSTLQDVRARRKTEVELYGVEICTLGAKLGVPTPENEALVRRIREIEAAYL